MCRHLAHVGPRPVTLASRVTEPPHSLLVQAYAPADMRGGGTVNADGFGVGWLAEDGAGHSYRQPVPMWTDASFLDLATAVRSTAFVAAVRSATVGMPVSVGACAPFRDGTRIFSHNGVVRGWPASLADLAAELDTETLMTLDAPTDSAVLWALVRRHLDAGKDPADAVVDVVTRALAAAPGSRLNLLLLIADERGEPTLVATAVDHALSYLVGDDGVTVASEPLDDDPGWTSVPDLSAVVVRGHDATPEVTPLT
ncbi:ergothioneine biosynthesis protein EgtC [Actinomycetospora endophytica]|uniref:Gamma-glutamyl-hercynylcysteine sulfoxide hydrolase n=1 Tax=Actinomycetospora endophytica TaxID=2291215 RepID=A0ABS8P9W6_9PSEU|nr:ergothioneine biosynthesis protein EgtC [Actinomycetospora endophytica]MCD2195066.1 ergothioneine biosynthesis protein EgtC [Actinomycetospora endophytica]